MKASSNTSADPVVEAELDRLPTIRIADLRSRYRELFRAEPPKAFGPDLLRRAIAQRIQERTYGGLPRATQRLLDQLIKAAAAANLIKSCCKPLPVPMLGSST